MTPKRTTRTLLVAAAAVAAIGFLGASGLAAPLMAPVSRVLSHAAAPAYAVGASARQALDAAFSNDTVDVGALRLTIEALRAENAKLRELQAENEALKTALDFVEREGDPGTLARVISEIADIHHGLIIDRGLEDGVLPGQAVVAGDGVIIGKILDARARTASVLLLSDSKSRLAVALQNGSGTLGVLEGDRGLSTTITLIPQTETVSPGDMVVTSGVEPGIRRGLIVGAVEKVNGGTQDPFRSATIEQFRSTFHPPVVMVLRAADAP